MAKESKLIQFYRDVLDMAGLAVDNEDMVKTNLSEEPMPAIIKVNGDSKRLILPTDKRLKSTDWNSCIAFHPLNENPFLKQGESKVGEFIRRAIIYRVNIVAHCLMDNILELSIAPALHKKLNPAQLQLMTLTKDADQKTYDNYVKITEKLGVTNTRDNFASLYSKKQGVIDGVKYARVGVWSFPLYQALVKSTGDVFGIKVRKKDLETYKALMEFIIPNIANEAEYMVGSNNQMSPYTDSLLRSTAKVVLQLNRVTDLLFKGKTFAPADQAEGLHQYLTFNTNWIDITNDISQLEKDVRMIPIQDNQVDTVPQQVTPTQTNNVQATPAMQPVQAAPAVANTGAPMYPNQPVMAPPVQAPQPVVQQQPMYPQQQQQQLPQQVQQAQPAVQAYQQAHMQQPVMQQQMQAPGTSNQAQGQTQAKQGVTMSEIANYQQQQALQAMPLQAANPYMQPAQQMAMQQMQQAPVIASNNPLVNPMAAAAQLGQVPGQLGTPMPLGTMPAVGPNGMPMVQQPMMPMGNVREGRLLSNTALMQNMYAAQMGYQQPMYPQPMLQQPIMQQPIMQPMMQPMGMMPQPGMMPSNWSR